MLVRIDDVSRLSPIDEFVDLLVCLEATDNVLIERAAGKRVDPKTKGNDVSTREDDRRVL